MDLPPQVQIVRGGDTPSMLGCGYNNQYIAIVRRDTYRVGDDVMFIAPGGKYCLHRVTHIRPGAVFTKGTFNKNGDGWTALKDIIGRAELVAPENPGIVWVPDQPRR